MKTQTTNKAKASVKASTNKAVKTETKKPTQSKEAVKKSEKIIFLADGVTGKQLQANKIDTNNEVKKENTSFSFCLKQVVKHDKGFISAFVNFSEADCTPKNLIPLLKGKEAINGKYSAWLIMTLIRRYYAQKK